MSEPSTSTTEATAESVKEEDESTLKPNLKRKNLEPKNCGEKKPRRKPWLSKDEDADLVPMNIPFEIRNGVRHLAPYWTVYRSRTKGRWLGRELVEVFSSEFLSTHKNYALVAVKLGRIAVNGEILRDRHYKLQNSDFIEHLGHRHEHPVLDTPIKIIENTPKLLVINKPPSMPVHACGQYAAHSVIGMLRREGMEGLRVLYRLDRTTSGILMFAKDYETDLEFKTTLKDGEWSKEYVCMVDGEFPEGEVVCEEPIGGLVLSMGIQCVRPDGKSTRSVFRRLWTDGKTSVVKVHIETGRTHQIRVHCQFLGYPITGDGIYNTDVWGPKKGKGADYGKSFEELVKDISDGHRSSHWHETVDPEYELRMERMAKEDVEIEPFGMSLEGRPDYDPICLGCNVVKKEAPAKHFSIPLHCLKYETQTWSYSTDLPEWAKKPEGAVE